MLLSQIWKLQSKRSKSFTRFNTDYVIRMSFACHLYALVFYQYVLVCHLYVNRMYSFVIRMLLVCAGMYSYVIRMSRVCTHMSSVCHSYVIRMSLVCTRMSSVCHSYVPVCHSYVTRMWFYHEPKKSLQKWFWPGRQILLRLIWDTRLTSLYQGLVTLKKQNNSMFKNVSNLDNR